MRRLYTGIIYVATMDFAMKLQKSLLVYSAMWGVKNSSVGTGFIKICLFWSIPSNYIPLSLTCIYSKLLEHSYLFRYIFALEEMIWLLCGEQHGFRVNRSCETQLISTVNDTVENMDNGKQTDRILLDFSAAFDRVADMRLLS